MREMLDVAIVGGGVAGLSCAFRLKQLSKNYLKPLALKVFEASDTFGGTIQTHHQKDCLLELGPDAMLSVKPAGMELIQELGLMPSVIQTNVACRRSFVASGDALKVIPEGFYMIAPSRLRSFMTSDILSLHGKLRALCEVVIRRSFDLDESVEQFITRRLGKEVFQKIGQPMVGGIYTGDPARLSMRHAVPRLKHLEQQYGSIIKGLLSERLKNKSATKDAGPRYSMFISFQKGMAEFVQALKEHVGEAILTPSSEVLSLRYLDDLRCWEINFKGKPSVYARALYLSLSANKAKKILPENLKEASVVMDAFEYESVALGNFIFERKQIKDKLKGFGFVVPAIEKKTLIAASYSSVKFAGRAPKDKVVIRAFVGGAFGRKHLQLSDSKLSENVLKELNAWLGIEGKPLFYEWKKHQEAMPQYTIGHEDRVNRLKQLCESVPSLYLGGSNYEGVGIPDCIASSNKVAEHIINQFNEKKMKGNK